MMVNPEEQKVRGTRMALSSLIDMAELAEELSGGDIELGEGQYFEVNENVINSVYQGNQGKYEIQIWREK